MAIVYFVHSLLQKLYFWQFWVETGLLILRDGANSHNRPQIASDRTIHEKSHNSQKDAQNS